MIEIIKKSNNNFTITCQYCDTKYSYQLEDIETTMNPIGTQDYNNNKIFSDPFTKCPYCNARNLHLNRDKKFSTIINE